MAGLRSITAVAQVRRRHGGFSVGAGGRPRAGRGARVGRPDASGGRPHVRTGRAPVRPHERDAPRERPSGVRDVRGHGIRARGRAGRHRQLQRAPGRRRVRGLQRGEP